MDSQEACDLGSPLYMDAVITPNRSLSREGLAILLTGMTVYNVALTFFFLAIGAFPVPLFLGLDFAALLVAFQISNRRARRAERVRVSAESVSVLRDAGGKSTTVWASPTAFTRVHVENGDDEAEVQLQLSGHALTVARALSPRERADFARALERAILRARAERYA